MGLLEAMRLRAAARRYAAALPGHLARNCGVARTYTPGQIGTAIKALRLDPGFIALALAAYLDEADYEDLRPTLVRPIAYKTARRAFLRELPGHPSSVSWDNANTAGAYVDGDGGGHH